MLSTTTVFGISYADIAKVLLGALATAVYAAISTRRTRLLWRASHQSLAASSDAPGIGRIAVTLDGNPMTNLVLSSVTVQNSYWRDLKDVVIRVMVAEGHQILRDSAQRAGDPKILIWSDQFRTMVDDAAAATTRGKVVDVSLLQRLREYRVPALNRGESITVNLLVHAVPPRSPYCLLATDTPGVITVFRNGAEQQVLGVPVFKAFFLGIIVAYPLAQLIRLHVDPMWHPLSFVVLGALLTGLGAMIVRCYRWVRQQAF